MSEYLFDDTTDRDKVLLSDLRDMDRMNGDVYCEQCEEEKVHREGELCGECLSEQASYYHPDEGGEQ